MQCKLNPLEADVVPIVRRKAAIPSTKYSMSMPRRASEGRQRLKREVLTRREDPRLRLYLLRCISKKCEL